MKAIYLSLMFASATMFAGTALAQPTLTHIDAETSLCGDKKKGGETFCGDKKKGGETFCGDEKAPKE